jgi:hypothetical protein
MTPMNTNDNPERLSPAAGSLTVDQMADALGLYACDFWAKHPRDCDVCSAAKEGKMIWVMMAGAYPGSTQEAEYYACSECVAIKHAAAFSSENDKDQAQPENQNQTSKT